MQMSESWQPDIREPFVAIRSLEETPLSVWTDEKVIEWCREIQEGVPTLSREISFPATSPTTILPVAAVRDETFFRMRHVALGDPDLTRHLPNSLLNLILNYSGIIKVVARDAASATGLNGDMGPITLPDTNHRRIEAFVTNSELGEASDWHVDEKLTLAFYPQKARLLVSWLRNPRNTEDVLNAPFTDLIIDYGQFVLFDGVNHPHKGFQLPGTPRNSDRVVLGFLYDMVHRKTEGPPLDDLLKH